MDLFNKILECKEEEVDEIITNAIEEANKNSEKVDKLGFIDYSTLRSAFKGFIPLKTRIKYSNVGMEDYGMETTDFLYDFAHFIRKNNISNKVTLIYYLESFVNDYFGMSGKISRTTIFNEIAWQTTTTDEEYFAALDNNKLGDLRGNGAAQCTEKGALVQQVLSLFGFESYYCIGCVDLGDKQIAHCFNIVKRKNDYALLDYSVPVTSFNKDGSVKAYYPFVGIISNEEFLDFINNGTIKPFDSYYMNDKNKVSDGIKRRYIVGKYKMEKEKKI